MSKSKKTSDKVIQYEPTPPEVVEHFARNVCEELGEGFTDHDTVRGFANFMKVVVRVTTNQLNQQADNQVDNSA
ncbi:hypothetical protein ACFLYO_04325 [Chloroflexota bacterium]